MHKNGRASPVVNLAAWGIVASVSLSGQISMEKF